MQSQGGITLGENNPVALGIGRIADPEHPPKEGREQVGDRQSRAYVTYVCTLGLLQHAATNPPAESFITMRHRGSIQSRSKRETFDRSRREAFDMSVITRVLVYAESSR